jgi:hypothetical protein
MVPEQLRRALAEIGHDLDGARAHLLEARDRLEQYRRSLTEVQGQARPWLPPRLDDMIEQARSHQDRLGTVADLLSRYGSRL